MGNLWVSDERLAAIWNFFQAARRAAKAKVCHPDGCWYWRTRARYYLSRVAGVRKTRAA